MAILSPAARPATHAGRRKRILFIGCAAFLVAAAIGFWFISANWPSRFRKIRPMLEDDLASQVTVTSYHRTYFPNPGFVAPASLFAVKQPSISLLSGTPK